MNVANFCERDGITSPHLLCGQGLAQQLSSNLLPNNRERTRWTLPTTRQAAIVLGTIVLTAALFKLTFAPPLSAGPYTLRMSPVIYENVAAALSHHWTALLLPFAYEGPRNFWATTAIFPMVLF